MKFLIINLIFAKERRKYIVNLCNKYGLDFEIIEAVNGRELSLDEYENIIHQDKMKFYLKRELGLGEVGCALSHKKCYKKIISENLPYAVILEDDAIFDKKLLDFLEAYREFPEDLELLLLGHQRQVYNDDGYKINSPYSRRFCKKIQGIKIRRLVGRGNGTYGYFITQKGATKLLEKLNKIYLPIDAMTSNENFVNVYAIFPTLIDTNSRFMLETSTQDNINLSKKRSKFQKVLKKWYIFFKFFFVSFKNLRNYN